MQEIQVEGKPFLLDPSKKAVYKEVQGGVGAAPEQVGKWVKVRIHLVPGDVREAAGV